MLGCGFVGLAVARRLRATGRSVVATTREPTRARALAALGIDAHVTGALSRHQVEALVPAGAEVLVSFPPDGHTDRQIASALARARAVVYVSSTAVYGKARGRVDEQTPVDPSSPRAAARLEAERAFLDEAGAVVLRAAGIYGPGRGLHLRLARGDLRVYGQGTNVVSRVHVEDLAVLACVALERAHRGAIYVAADDAPVPQIEAIRWLCEYLGLPLPPVAPASQAPETLRHDRAVDNARVKRDLAISLAYPTYREGFAHCIAIDGLRPAAQAPVSAHAQ